MVAEEKAKIAAAAAAAVAASKGGAEVADAVGGASRGSMLLEGHDDKTPRGKKSILRSGAAASKTATPVVQIQLDEGSVTVNKGTAADDINLNFIMWGHSQKVQLAGVSALVLLFRFFAPIFNISLHSLRLLVRFYCCVSLGQSC